MDVKAMKNPRKIKRKRKKKRSIQRFHQCKSLPKLARMKIKMQPQQTRRSRRKPRSQATKFLRKMTKLPKKKIIRHQKRRKHQIFCQV